MAAAHPEPKGPKTPPAAPAPVPAPEPEPAPAPPTRVVKWTTGGQAIQDAKTGTWTATPGGK